MIVSASYKTDLPAFYGEWFMNRLRAGRCRMVNAFNPKQRSEVSLRPEHVDGFVFWTKNLAPFLPALEELRTRGTPFMLQYAINGYPRELEPRVVDPSRSAATLRAVATAHGPRVAVWRYDTIVFSSLTDGDFHRRNFTRIADQVAGATDEVVVSFMQVYQKTRRSLDAMARSHGVAWEDPPPDTKRDLLRELAAIAAARGLRLTVCGQPELLVEGVGEAHCIDANRLMDIAGKKFSAKLKGPRANCGCYEARDIGEYDTCPHGCVYCYAVRSRAVALARFRAHDPEGEYLIPPPGPEPEPKTLL